MQTQLLPLSNLVHVAQARDVEVVLVDRETVRSWSRTHARWKWMRMPVRHDAAIRALWARRSPA